VIPKQKGSYGKILWVRWSKFGTSIGLAFSPNCHHYSCCPFIWLALCKIGQPSVVGEILAGIVLGPSLAECIFPDFLLLYFQ